MKLLVIIFLTSACTTSTQQVPGSVKFSEQDAKLRRQAVSYSTSVIHQNPKYPDQHAQSSINVDFNPQKSNQQPQQQQQQQLSRPIIQNQQSATALYKNYNNQFNQQQLQQIRRPKSQQNYVSTNNVQFPRNPQFTPEDKQKQTRQVYKNIQKSSINYSPAQSQSFNVGYSVSFTGGEKHQPPRPFPVQKLENAEIITGSRKEPVRKPNGNFEANDFVNHALIDLKKQKVSGIKPKLNKFPNKDNDAKTFITNLAPKTQQYLSYLGEAKPIESSNIRFSQQIQSGGSDAQSLQKNQNLQTSWTNLSPSVEIYHSKEIPQRHSFTSREQLEQSKYFDHAGALGKSQGFDYSNAVDGHNEKQTQHTQLSSIPAHQEATENVISLEDDKNHFPFNSAVYDFTQNGQQAPLILSLPNKFDTISVLPTSNLQISQKSGDVQDIINQQQIPLFPTAQLPTVLPSNIPIDMSLLREPILSLNGKTLPNDPHTIPIPFDTSLLQAMQQKLLTSAQPIETYDVGKGQVQSLQGNVGITEQQYQGQVENLQVQPLQGIKQDNFQDQGFKQFQGQQQQSTQQQFNIYGSPHALFLKKDFDKYFEKKFDKMQTQESRFEEMSLMPPKINPSTNNNNIRARQMKGKEIHTSLQPPPIIKITRHRRMFI